MVSGTFSVYMTAALWAQLPLSCLVLNNQGNGNETQPGAENVDLILNNTDNGNETQPGEENVITPESLKLIEEDCRNSTNETCAMHCYYETLGIIDEHGWYVESKGIEFMNIVLMNYGIINYQETQFYQIATTCNRVNKNITQGCQRGEEVATCLNEEMKKITPEILKLIKENCRNSTNETCAMHCYYETIGIIDEDGWYVESKATELMTFEIIKNQETQFYQMAKNCNSVNKNITKGCQRGEEVAMCLNKEMKKAS
ncbi:uncharacterized protein LOC133533068 [Cydia pomonella]|uniref:uncharacterized protein LOC133533068 n=1 Tax=Cydia pomonella TaxID=82600 RepID=UPI002ADD7EB0|nr:uncharacterized protein LOC133533068 [Cydia pomonella]XP_061727990.1 uncharacterized protein LOC133533068 [Cydia pomonella]